MYVNDFANSYKEYTEYQQQHMLMLTGQFKEEVNESKYLGSILCKHGSMKGETRQL